ncbi:wax ester/triacylglycerol synthase domain-containing protein [Streptomyces sp. NPDC045431]|uniref:wax ester/triacylglycerol synthase domain-containing protein n=1 Tax=Streptomyces sp. NPDC045431 TaxID=3155613 RepID=UPI0033E4B7D9
MTGPADGVAAYPAVDEVIRAMEGPGQGHYLHIGAVLELDGPVPELAAVREHVRGRLPFLPLLALSVAGDLGDAGDFGDGGPDLDRHVRELRVERREAAYDALLNAAAPCPRRPWGVWLVHGYAENRFLLCYRGHHGLHDGVSLAWVMQRLFRTKPPAGALPSAGGPFAPTLPARVGAHARNALESVRLFLPAPRRPLLDGPREGRRVLSAVTVPVGRLRTAAADLGCSVLDIHLSALSYAAQRADTTGWTREGPRARGIGLPIALGPMGSATTACPAYPGNRFSVAVVDVPWDEADLRHRARLLSRRTARYKDPALRWAKGDALVRLDARRTKSLSERVFARCGVQTTVLTQTADFGFDGCRALSVTGLNCLPAHFPYQPVLTTWRSQATCAFTADAAVPAARELAEYWREALDLLAPEAAAPAPSIGR